MLHLTEMTDRVSQDRNQLIVENQAMAALLERAERALKRAQKNMIPTDDTLLRDIDRQLAAKL